MTNKELQDYLKQHADDMPIKLLLNHEFAGSVIDFTDEHILQTTDKAWVDTDAPEDEWDTEDGKVVYDGNPYLLFNPIIV